MTKKNSLYNLLFAKKKMNASEQAGDLVRAFIGAAKAGQESISQQQNVEALVATDDFVQKQNLEITTPSGSELLRMDDEREKEESLANTTVVFPGYGTSALWLVIANKLSNLFIYVNAARQGKSGFTLKEAYSDRMDDCFGEIEKLALDFGDAYEPAFCKALKTLLDPAYLMRRMQEHKSDNDFFLIDQAALALEAKKPWSMFKKFCYDSYPDNDLDVDEDYDDDDQ